MPLEEILKTNARFLAENRPEPQPHEPRKHWAVVSCMDFRLSDFLERAIGVRRGDAIMIRNAGNTRTPTDSSVIRSLLAGVLLFDIREVLVIGHTRCGMRMDVANALDRMKTLGIPREALGVHDVREWLGIIPDESENVRQVVQAIAASPFIPKTIAIYGFVIDVETGGLAYIAGRLAPGELPPTQKNSGIAGANKAPFVPAPGLPSR
ncbi:MAG: carbonic anhydrase [Planctomycetes bacterium]|nr:carbonic anhydrase [Planctomycetota bacterium]MBI3848242.1 carbonic anhydrase [Planctomycetota bacterium]